MIVVIVVVVFIIIIVGGDVGCFVTFLPHFVIFDLPAFSENYLQSDQWKLQSSVELNIIIKFVMNFNNNKSSKKIYIYIYLLIYNNISHIPKLHLLNQYYTLH